jgi:acylphosphatase
MSDQQSDVATTKVRVRGRVQGVWFRGWVIEQAQSLNLNGWVRNRADGTVEAVFSGPEEAVTSMVNSCKKGPPSAQVDDLEAKPSKKPTNSGFIQLGTC